MIRLFLPLALVGVLPLSLPALAETAAGDSAAPLPAKIAPIRGSHTHGWLTVETTDLTPQFFDFQQEAQGKSPDERFAIWQSRYGFAAVPPTPEGRAMARSTLDRAWPRYVEEQHRMAGGLANIEKEALAAFGQSALLLGLDRPARMGLLGFVGGFEENAFTFVGSSGTVTVALPVEVRGDRAALLAAHEGTHAVHILTAGLSGSYERTVARIVVEEGIAMHASKALLPGKPDAFYTEFTPSWHAEAQQKRKEVLAGLLPFVASKRIEDVTRFTITKGPAGLEREAYAAGWTVIGHLLAKGWTLEQLAHVREGDMPDLVCTAIADILQRKTVPCRATDTDVIDTAVGRSD